MTWRLQKASDGQHYDVWRIQGDGLAGNVPQQKVQATSLIVKTLFTYDAATPASSPRGDDEPAVRRHRRSRRRPPPCGLLRQTQEQGGRRCCPDCTGSATRQDGFGLILVIGVTAFVTVLIVTASMVAVHGLKQSQNRAKFEQSLASAENGVDSTLASLQKAFDDYNADYPIPSLGTLAEPTPACSARRSPSRRRSPPRPPRTPGRGRSWRRRLRTPMLADRGERRLPGPEAGDAAGQRAYPKYGRIYALGWSPSHRRPPLRRPDPEDRVRLHAVPAHPRRPHRAAT